MAAWEQIQMVGGESTLEIQGFKELVDTFENLPDAHQKKIIKMAFRKGANVFKKQVAALTPARAKKMNKALSVKAKGNVITAGYFANKGVYVNNRGTSWDLYQLMYWFNYGTLTRRDTAHNFTRPRAKVSVNWLGGIKPRKFVESAWTASQTTVQKAVNDTLVSETEKEMLKNVVK